MLRLFSLRNSAWDFGLEDSVDGAAIMVSANSGSFGAATFFFSERSPPRSLLLLPSCEALPYLRESLTKLAPGRERFDCRTNKRG